MVCLLALVCAACDDSRVTRPLLSEHYQLLWLECEGPMPERIRCAELVLPAEQDRLPVRVVQYTGQDKSHEPLVYLQGGPGYRLSLDAEGMLSWQSFAEQAGLKRDLILLNRRGSEQRCPEYDKARYRAMASSPYRPATVSNLDQALLGCINQADTLAIDAYGTRHNAADIRALVAALGAEGWHLLGVSYGSRLAIELAGSDGLQSMILDSVYPPGFGGVIAVPELLGGSIQRVAQACESDPNCLARWRSHYGEKPLTADNFLALLRSSLKLLEQRPIDVLVTVNDWPETFWLTPERFLSAAFAASYNRHRWPLLVDAIASVPGRQRQRLARFAQLSVVPSGAISATAYAAVDCLDNHLGSDAQYQQGFVQFPWLKPYMASGWHGQICQRWEDFIEPLVWPEHGPERVAVVSGEFDPITPVEWGEALAERWPQVKRSVFAATGHSIMSNRPCALAQLERFVSQSQNAIAPCVDTTIVERD